MKNLLIIGGCGFIGSNAVLYFLKKNYRVSVIDNLSGSSSKKNLNLIKKTYPKINFSKVNIKNYKNLSQFIKKLKPNYIIFAAGQVAVTKSVQNPREDFESTMLGAFNVLESIRNYSSKSSLIYSSSNKVYGNLKKLKI